MAIPDHRRCGLDRAVPSALTAVIGVPPTAVPVLIDLLSRVAKVAGLGDAGLAGPARAAWSGATAIGFIHLVLTDDRLVVTSGDPAAFVNASSAAPSARDHLAIAIDLPACGKQFLPLLYALAPAKPMWFEETPLHGFLREVGSLSQLAYDKYEKIGRADQRVLNVDESKKKIHQDDAWRRLHQGRDEPLNPSIAIFAPADADKRQSGLYRELRYVFRIGSEWMIGHGPFPQLSPSIGLDRFALDRALTGLELVAGTHPELLKPLPIGDQPSFDHRWLPDPAVVMDHLPRYQLRINAADGVHAEEDGLPLSIAALLPLFNDAHPSRVKHHHLTAVFEQQAPTHRQRHQRAIDALRAGVRRLQRRQPGQPPLMKTSQMLATAGVPLADLASLNGGTTPTPAQVDALGFWRPHAWPHNDCLWLVPIGPGWFVEMAWMRPEGADVTNDPHTPRSHATPAEIQKVMGEWQRRHGKKDTAPAPRPPLKPDKKAEDF